MNETFRPPRRRPSNPGLLVVAVTLTSIALHACGGDRMCPSPRIQVGAVCAFRCPDFPEQLCGDDGRRLDVMAPLIDAAAMCEGGGECRDLQTDPNHCGACGRTCPGATGGRATCVAGVCQFDCMPGYHACGTGCAANDAPATCGSMCTPCAAPVGAEGTCIDGACGFRCRAGFDRVPAGCEPPPPRPIAPLSTAVVTSRRPTLHWLLPSTADGAVVEVCSDHAMTANCVSFDATGNSGRPAMPLAPHMWFWRVRSKFGGYVGGRASPVWEFYVQFGDRTTDTSWGNAFDVNNDGIGDIAVGGETPAMGGAVEVYLGSSRRMWTAPDAVLTDFLEAPPSSGTKMAGADINGDGFGDVLVGTPSYDGQRGGIAWFAGGVSGASGGRLFTAPIDARIRRFGTSVANAGDVNGDGFVDVIVTADGPASRAVFVLLGGRAPVLDTAHPIAVPLRPEVQTLLSDIGPIGDANGDGFADFFVCTAGASGSRVDVYLGDRLARIGSPAATVEGGSASGFGDMDGDGFSDLVVGDAGWSDGTNHAYPVSTQSRFSRAERPCLRSARELVAEAEPEHDAESDPQQRARRPADADRGPAPRQRSTGDLHVGFRRGRIVIRFDWPRSRGGPLGHRPVVGIHGLFCPWMNFDGWTALDTRTDHLSVIE